MSFAYPFLLLKFFFTVNDTGSLFKVTFKILTEFNAKHMH